VKHSVLPLALVTMLSIAFGEQSGQAQTAPPQSVANTREIILNDPEDGMEIREIEIVNYQEALELFQELNYTPEAWAAGIRDVPRAYVTTITEDWRARKVKQMTVTMKKQLFFRLLAPLALRANELINAERNRLTAIIASARPTPEDTAWLQRLAIRYGVIKSTDQPIMQNERDELLRRVDIIPVSLVLAQGAIESGWAESSFAARGNALFGQWTWGEFAMVPEKQRKELGNYGIESFETPLLSVISYLRNLNSHRAYRDLRARRATARERGEEPTGKDIALGLSNYSELGEEYIKSLHSIMRVNSLDATDKTTLRGGPVIYLIPVGASTE
jgi:Bax protein